MMTKEIVAKRKWRYPLSYERDYAKALTAYVDRKFKIIRAFLPEMTAAIESPSAMNARIEIVIDEIRRAVENAETMTNAINHSYQLVDRYNEKEFDAIIGSVFGKGTKLDGRPMTKRTDAVDDLAELKDLWVRENLDLIKSIDEDTLQRLKRMMTQAILDNVNGSELTKYLIDDLQDITGVIRSRAALIGTDQVGKLNGRLSQYRQEHAGLTSYIWETCHDSRVRKSHAARNGHRYYWSNPPPDGHPGMPIRCRCVALPVIDVNRIPIRTKRGTFVYVNSQGTPGTSEANRGTINIKNTTTKLKATMEEADYNEFVALVEKNDDVAKLYSKADGVDEIHKTRSRGCYEPYFNSIEWSYPDKKYIANGRHKFHTLAHEHGHYFDAKLMYKGLTHHELDALNGAITEQWARLAEVASSSDQFLATVRKDMPGLEKAYTDELRLALSNDDSSCGLQDSYDGLFVGHRILWGHGDRYYNRNFKAIERAGDYKAVKAALEKLGFTVKRKSDAAIIVRQYEAASEIWANISAGVTVSPKELQWFKNYMPNTYKAYIKIIKEVEA